MWRLSINMDLVPPIAEVLRRSEELRSTMTSSDSTRAKGNRGEELALNHLIGLGYLPLARNWRCRSGELDLVMRDNDCVVFVEVKARHGERAGRAQLALSFNQSRRMLNAGEWFIADHPEFSELFWRCDLVAITTDEVDPPVIEHFVNAIVAG